MTETGLTQVKFDNSIVFDKLLKETIDRIDVLKDLLTTSRLFLIRIG